jgi:predicted O-methyltransferase YrrM
VGLATVQIARLMGAKRIFELGSGYGYSTAWFAKAVQENGGGVVYHTVWDTKLSQKAQKHLTALGFGDIVQYQVSEAVQALRETPGPFDLVFNDIHKEGYPESLSAIEEKLRPGGALVVGNVLWGGRIFDESDRSSSTEGIRELTHRLTTDLNWVTTVIPVRDCLLVAYKN